MPTLLGRFAALLRDARAFRVLFGLHVLLVIAGAVLLWNTRSGDHQSYWELARGILQGRYSVWHSLDPYPPDTFRTPGYPLFLALASLGGTSLRALLVVQAALYLAAVGLVCRILRRLVPDDLLPRTLFLLVLVPNVQLVYYTALVLPECLLGFLIVAYLDAETAGRHWAICGLLLGAMILVRPVYLLYPLVRVGLGLLAAADRQAATRRALGVTAVAIAVMLPYGAWNQVQFGLFRLIPLEGSAPNVHMGFWQHRLPGKVTHRYWRSNFQGRELIPFVSDADANRYLEAYHREWDAIETEAAPYFTETDRRHQAKFDETPTLFTTYSRQYTVARAKIIEQYTWNHVRAEPGYYLATRLYTAVRLWMTGVNLRTISQPGLRAKVAALYPTLITLGLAGGLLLTAVRALRGQPELRGTLPIWSLLVYAWLVHVPVTIQSRYTVPLHLAALLLGTLALAGRIRGDHSGTLAPPAPRSAPVHGTVVVS